MSVVYSCTNIKIQTSPETRHQVCCVQSALHMSHLYYHGQGQLQTILHHLKATQNELEKTRHQLLDVEQELQREREAGELLNQHCTELQECHHKLLKEHKSSEELQKDLRKSANDSKIFADEVARRAESLVDHLQAKLAGGEVAELQNGQSISGIILESAKNALLVEAISGQPLDQGPLTPLNFVTEQNVGLQQRNSELSIQVETLSRQVEDGKNEVATLNAALKLTAEDGRRKKPRRGKMSVEKK